MSRNPGTITLIGAGLNGPLLAIGLKRRGRKVRLLRGVRRTPGSVSAGRHQSRSCRLAAFTLSNRLWSGMQDIIIDEG
jgi:2-polyprenyl-6-methoxyphenol hydroxylase-like FAD-dependent oxidoreductase